MHRGVLADVPLEPDGADAIVARVDPLERRERAVGRPVVHVDDLVRPREDLERRRQPAVELVERRTLLEQGHDDRDLRAGAGRDVPLGGAQGLGPGHRLLERTPLAWRG